MSKAVEDMLAALYEQVEFTRTYVLQNLTVNTSEAIAKEYENVDSPLIVHGEMLSDYPTQKIASAVSYIIKESSSLIFLDDPEAETEARKYAVYRVSGNPFEMMRVRLRDLPELRKRYAGL